MLLNWKFWLHGLGSAFITGAATSFAAAFIKPDTFNIASGFHDLLKLALVSGVVGAAAYLKSSPLPAIQQEIDLKKGN